MKSKTALVWIRFIAILGLLFSGYLSYYELFGGECIAISLGMGQCVDVQGIPACVYGFVMYLIVFLISWSGLRSKEN